MMISRVHEVVYIIYQRNQEEIGADLEKLTSLEIRTVGSHYVTKFDESLCQRETELAIFHYISDHFILDLILIVFG